MGCLVYVPLLFLCVANYVVHGEIYIERENEETIRRRCRPSLSCFPDQLEWAKLENDLTGMLVWPDNYNYTMYNFQYQFRTQRFPIVHVVCKNTKDIQLAVRFARQHNLRVTIKSSGFDFWGRSTAHSGYSINLMEMKHISVNPSATDRSEHGEVTVETGLNSKEVYEEVEKYNRIILTGTCVGVSLGGFIASGGTGKFSPALGLGVDNVLEIKAVLADGRVATCTHNKTLIEDDDGSIETHNNGDLFWALRGGGGGTFAIVVHYVLKLHQSKSSYIKARIRGSLYRNESDKEILEDFKDTFLKWVEDTPAYWGAGMVVLPGAFIGSLDKLGPWDAETESEIGPWVDFQSRFHEQVRIEITNFSKSAYVVIDPTTSGRNYVTGALLRPQRNDAGSVWDFLIQSVMDRHAEDVGFVISVRRLGGKVAEFDASSSAVNAGFRRAQYALAYSFQLPKDHELSSIEQQEQIEPLVAQFAQKLRRYQDGQYGTIGYIPSPDWKMDFWGEHYVELLKVKIRYDPDNFFTCYHCVGSDRTDFDEPTAAAVGITITGQLVACLVLLTVY